MRRLPLLLLAPVAWTGSEAIAGDTAYTCVAVWQGPTESCDLGEDLEAKGAGRTESAATRQAMVRLRLALASASRATMLGAQGTLAAVEVAQLTSCLKLPDEELRVTCFPQPKQGEQGLCYADLPDDPCWDVDMLIVEGGGWQAQEQARVELCEQVQQAAEQHSKSEVEQLRCNARCLTQVRVRCP